MARKLNTVPTATDISALSDDAVRDLEKQILARKATAEAERLRNVQALIEIRRQKERDVHLVRHALFMQILVKNPVLVDLLAPKHDDGAECSDKGVRCPFEDGYYFNPDDQDTQPCARCSLMAALKSKKFHPDFCLSVSVVDYVCEI